MSEADELPSGKGKWLDEARRVKVVGAVKALEAGSHLKSVEVC